MITHTPVIPDNSDNLARPPSLTSSELFLKFLKFGCLAFGGPVAQIAMVRHSLVEEEGWVTSAKFNRLLAVMQALPGPEAHELCVHMGMLARGRIGGLLAGLGFMLPGFLLMLLAGWFYRNQIAGNSILAAAFLGVQIVVLAIIARAVSRIGAHTLEDWRLAALAALAFAATLAGVPFLVPLFGAGVAYAGMKPKVFLVGVATIAIITAISILGSKDAIAAPAIHQHAAVPLLFIAGLKGGLLTFGGAYSAIPYVRSDTVGRGWLPDSAFLDGVALAGVLPAPLVIFATFAGYVAAGFEGAIAITAGIFLPAFAFSLIFYERLEALIENPKLIRFLAGVAAAVVGVIGATLLELAGTVYARVSNPRVAAVLLIAALVCAWRLKGRWVNPGLVIAAGVAGCMLTP